MDRADFLRVQARFVPADDLPALSERQRASDERLIAFCNALDAAGCARSRSSTSS